MGWIKRNLFFVIGGGVALVLLGGAGYYNYQGWSRNSAAADKLNEIYGTLKNLAEQKPAPGNDKIDNTKIAREQEQQIREESGAEVEYFYYDADHAFHNDENPAGNYQEAEAKLAWGRAVSFLKEKVR